jgi:hypothetical protein
VLLSFHQCSILVRTHRRRYTTSAIDGTLKQNVKKEEELSQYKIWGRHGVVTCSYGSEISEDNRTGQNARESVKSKKGGFGEKENYWKYCVCAN